MYWYVIIKARDGRYDVWKNYINDQPELVRTFWYKAEAEQYVIQHTPEEDTAPYPHSWTAEFLNEIEDDRETNWEG